LLVRGGLESPPQPGRLPHIKVSKAQERH
jgi:hypothetical protein